MLIEESGPEFTSEDCKLRAELPFVKGAALLLAFDMAAFRTWASVGLIPQARHGGRGVCALAAAGSKFEGTGFEKLQMVQTQVAVLTAGGSVDG